MERCSEIWESLLHRSVFTQGGRLSALVHYIAIFMPKTIQVQNTFIVKPVIIWTVAGFQTLPAVGYKEILSIKV